jgi:NADH-quinone oxidoreductase subunit K
MDKLHFLLLIAMALFAIGLLGVIVRRNLLVMLMCMELMLNGVNLSLVAFAQQTGTAAGAGLVFLIFVVAAAEIAIAIPRPARAPQARARGGLRRPERKAGRICSPRSGAAAGRAERPSTRWDPVRHVVTVVGAADPVVPTAARVRSRRAAGAPIEARNGRGSASAPSRSPLPRPPVRGDGADRHRRAR